MFVALILFGSFLFLIHRYYSARNRYWTDRGVPGPEPELLFGNLRAIWAYDRPRALVLQEWTKQFGKVYGYLSGQLPVLVVSDVAMINEIFIKRFENFHAHAKTELQGTENEEGSHMAQASGVHWKRLRTLSTDAFSTKAVRNIFPTIKDSAKQIVGFIEKQKGSEIDAMRYFREYTMDVISRVTLGKEDNKMFENKLVTWCSQFFLMPLSFWVTALASLFPFFLPLWKIAFISSIVFTGSSFISMMIDIKKTVKERKRAKDAGELPKNDIISMFLSAESDDATAGEKASCCLRRFGKNTLSLEEINANCKLFLLAGYDTTSIAISRAVHFLATHPQIQQRLKDEIDDVIGSEDYDLEDVGNLRYAEAVIKETLRHHPMGSGFTTRECTTACEVGGFRFEKGDSIFADVWSLQMDKEVWGEDAEEFRPERWLEDATIDRASFLAFGAGPRICIGMKLALVEAKVALVELLRNFTIVATENTKSLKMVGSLMVAPEHVIVSMRKNHLMFKC